MRGPAVRIRASWTAAAKRAQRSAVSWGVVFGRLREGGGVALLDDDVVVDDGDFKTRYVAISRYCAFVYGAKCRVGTPPMPPGSRRGGLLGDVRMKVVVRFGI